MVAADSAFKLIAVNELHDEVYASAAISDGGILIRTAHELFFIERKDIGRLPAA